MKSGPAGGWSGGTVTRSRAGRQLAALQRELRERSASAAEVARDAPARASHAARFGCAHAISRAIALIFLCLCLDEREKAVLASLATVALVPRNLTLIEGRLPSSRVCGVPIGAVSEAVEASAVVEQCAARLHSAWAMPRRSSTQTGG